jgi:pilus assembly protein CpaC
LGDLPVIGSLFRSQSFQRQETELVILVTPYIVRPVDDVAKLHTPDEHFSNPTDLERILQLRQMGADPSGTRVASRIPGAAGFIVQ